jgi:hypothetical protein
MDRIEIDIISLIILLTGIIWINNDINLRKFIYVLLILIIIGLRTCLSNL